MNRSLTILAVAGIIIAGSIVFSNNVTTVDAQQGSTAQTRRSNTAQQQTRSTFQYATLTTRAIEDEENSRVTFEIAWNSEDNLINVSSQTSLEDAYRRLINRRRGTVGRVTLLSSLLNHFGAEGWELIETQNRGSLNERLFIRQR